MSNTTKWVVGIIIILGVVLIAWQSGILGGPAMSPETATSTGSMTDNSTVTPQTVSALDVELTTGGAAIHALDQELSAAKIAVVTAQLTVIAREMAALANALTAHIANSPAADRPALQATLNDMGKNLSNATSLITAVADNSKTASAEELKQEKTQLQSALIYLQAARADIAAIIRG